jgi:hypothetical protein
VSARTPTTSAPTAALLLAFLWLSGVWFLANTGAVALVLLVNCFLTYVVLWEHGLVDWP